MSNIHSPAHVVYIITKLELGGAQKVCLELLDGLSTQPNGASLISGNTGPLVNHAQRHSSVFLLSSMQREIGLKSLFSECRVFIDLVRVLKQLKCIHPNIIVHTHSTKAGLLGRWAAWMAGVHIRVHTIHGYGFHQHQSFLAWFITFLCEWLTAPLTSHFVCVSKQDQETGNKLLPTFSQKNSIIRAAVTSAPFVAVPTLRKTLPLNDQKIIIGTVACFKPQKNIPDLIKAFAALYKRATPAMQQKLQLHVVGDGAQRRMLEQLIKRLEIDHAVVLLGWQQDISYWMAQWQVFALSSLWEGLPCSIIEARMAQLPVVAYNVGGISDVIQDGINGFLIPPGQWELLSYTLELIVNNATVRQQLSSRQDYLEPFLVTSMIQQHTKLYTQLEKPISST